ncbi:hypothetical protein BDZ88DRAFT_455460 [Geranomyces variabilis]|nr:hypothetical protein BDZ88DRAFT_455460 [Geranomyces variabilis]KAJ3132769.1 hypothetical protein HDU90_006657 [Geranomyces variabilis]
MLEELQAENKLLRQRLAKTEAELEKRSVPESTFLGRLARNEQDVLALTAELQELGKLAHPDVEDTKRKLLDPTWVLLYKAMRREVDDKNKKIENLQREILGVGFNPNSITGKKIVSKLRALQIENEELGRQLCQGRVQQLQTALALELARREELETPSAASLALESSWTVLLKSQYRRFIFFLFLCSAEAAATELELENENQELHATAVLLQSKLQRYEEAAAAAAASSPAEMSAQSGVK